MAALNQQTSISARDEWLTHFALTSLTSGALQFLRWTLP
jgi:hypothetical protein